MHKVITTQLEQKGQRTFSTACSDEKPLVKAIRPEKTTGGLQAFAPTALDSASLKRHAEPNHTKNAMPSDATEAKRIRIDARVHDAFPGDECESNDGLTQEMLGVIEGFEKEHHAHGTKYHVIQVIRQDDHQPTFILMGKEATVVSIVVAETKLDSLTPAICMTTSGGTRYPSASTTKPYDQVFLKEMSKYGSGTTRDQVTMPLELTFHEPIHRIALLYRREAYVAENEIQLYVKMLTATGQAVHAPIASIPNNCEDLICTNAAGSRCPMCHRFSYVCTTP